MKPKVYIETTIPSYLTAWPSRDLVRAAHQQLTKQWWDARSQDFDLYISQTVLEEITAGDPVAAAERIKAVKDLPTLAVTEAARMLADALILQVPLPKKAEFDALHIAIAVVTGMEYLLTWNCTHIANASIRGRIESICRAGGYEPPVICTPEELMGNSFYVT